MTGHHEANSTAARSLREALARSRLTTEQLVAKVGCTRKSISNWRNGQRPNDYFIGRLVEVLGVDLWSLYTTPAPHQGYRQFSGREAAPEKLCVGGLSIDWIVLALERFRPAQIHSVYDRTPISLPSDLEQLRIEYLESWRSRSSSGDTSLPFNSSLYKLKEFYVGFREIMDGEEVPMLRFKFGPTDYFTQIVTDLNTEDPARRRYAQAVPITQQPVPEFASILGVNLSLITRDNYLIVSERHARVYFAAGKLHTSVAESIQRPMDAGPNGAPDPFRAASRGAHEELGIELSAHDIEFGAFGVQPDLCQYSLLGAHRLAYTKDEVLKLRSFGVPKDKWESSRLHFVPYDPDAVAQFAIVHQEQWVHIGLAAVVLSLWQMGHSLGEIDSAFARARMARG